MKKIYVLFLCFLLTKASFALPYFWIGGTAGAWNTATNWSATSGGSAGSFVPGANDDVTFDNGLTITVNYNASGNSIGFKTFQIINNTQLILENTVSLARDFGINNTAANFTVVASGSSLILRSTVNFEFSLKPVLGRMVFDGPLRIEALAANTSRGARIDASGDSVIINNTLYYGPQISTNSTSSITGGRFRFGAAAILHWDINGKSIPAGTYDPDALINITGITTTPTNFGSGTGVTYPKVTINCPNFANTSVFNNIGIPSSTIFAGDFKVVNLGASAGNILALTGSNTPITFLKNFEISALLGKVVTNYSGTMQRTININGDLIMSGGANLDLSANSGSGNDTLRILGNINQTAGVITESGATTSNVILLNGTTNQNVSFATAGITEDITFVIKNPDGVTGLTDINLSAGANALLKLTSGNIDMKTNNKFIFAQNPSNISVSVGSNSSHIIGVLKRASNTINGYSFPVSNSATEMKKAIITTAAATPTVWTVEFVPSGSVTTGLPIISNGDGIGVVAPFYWNIQRAAGGADAEYVTLFYNFASSGVIASATTKIVHYTGSAWESFGGDDGGGSIDNNKGTNGMPTTGGNNITNFSPFTFGALDLTILSTNLTSFTVNKAGNTAQINWAVSSNISTQKMELLKSVDGRNYHILNTIVGNATQTRYNTIDPSLVYGVNYYKLKITDRNGQVTYSQVAIIFNADKGFEIAMYPTLVKNVANVQVSSLKAGKAQWKIFDLVGKAVATNSIQTIEGSQNFNLPVSHLSNGTYNLVITNFDGERKVIRFIKQ